VLHHENWFMQWSFRQVFDIAKYIIQNGINLFGPGLFNKDMFTISSVLLDQQIKHF